MNQKRILEVLRSVQQGTITAEGAIDALKHLPFEDIGFAKVDHHRELRNGFPEVVFCPGKTPEHLKGIIEKLLKNSDGNILATRATEANFEAVYSVCPQAEWHKGAGAILIRREAVVTRGHTVLVVTAGTSDIGVAEEACLTAELMGNPVDRLYDVGVAGIHRLFAHRRALDEAGIIIVVAGMEGALASVIGGLVNKPVIAVPTSIGYGAQFGGAAALLAMLNSCANGLGVMNIDNGYGAAYMATRINRLFAEGPPVYAGSVPRAGEREHP